MSKSDVVRTPHARMARAVRFAALAAVVALVPTACGDDPTNLDDPAAGVVFTGSSSKSVKTPSTFVTTTVLVTTTWYFPDGTVPDEALPDDSASETTAPTTVTTTPVTETTIAPA